MRHKEFNGRPLCNTTHGSMDFAEDWDEVNCKRCLMSKERYERLGKLEGKAVKRSFCFGCGKWFDEQNYDGDCNFSVEWDTWCHSKCCPTDGAECRVCEHGGED